VKIGGGFVKSERFQQTKSVSRTRGFTLSDGDEYDVFDVQVCIGYFFIVIINYIYSFFSLDDLL
jgi:hypothetical protein